MNNEKKEAIKDFLVLSTLSRDAAFWVFEGRRRGLKVAATRKEAAILLNNGYCYLFHVEKKDKKKWILFENTHAIFTGAPLILEEEWGEFRAYYEDFMKEIKEQEK